MNLLRGLRKIGVPVAINIKSELNGCLNLGAPTFDSLPMQTLMGPNIMVAPGELPLIWARHKHFVVPSSWVRDYYNSYTLAKDANLHIWAVGIDTERFNAAGRDPSKDCFIYFKSRSESELQQTEDELSKRKLTYSILRYGNYKEEDLIYLSKTCRFCILLTEGETQGLAAMEILACDVPCFVISQEKWDAEARDLAPWRFAVPYFSDGCGSGGPNLSDRSFDRFLENLGAYHPHEYILSEHTLEKSANRYVEILNECHR